MASYRVRHPRELGTPCRPASVPVPMMGVLCGDTCAPSRAWPRASGWHRICCSERRGEHPTPTDQPRQQRDFGVRASVGCSGGWCPGLGIPVGPRSPG